MSNTWYFNAEKQLLVKVKVITRRKLETIFSFSDMSSDEKICEISLSEYINGGAAFSADGEKFFYIADMKLVDGMPQNPLNYIDLENKIIKNYDFLTPAFGCKNVSCNNNLISYFKGESLIVKTLDGVEVFQKNFDLGKYYTAEISPDGKLIAVSTGKNELSKTINIQLFSLENKGLADRIIMIDDSVYNENSIAQIQFHPTGKYLFALGYYANFFAIDIAAKTNFAAELAVKQLDLADGIPTKHLHYPYRDMDISRDGKRLVLVTNHCDVFLYDIDARALLNTYNFEVETKVKKQVKFIDDQGRKFFFGTGLGTYKIVAAE